eukprot:TRINITY_DN196_c0_g1_i1.p1 TRINITY_DN196_c0_g1~~TRINITY_DN196_c0_g1_i1.p1  ORF type:complete len:298 (+),score=28.71 TRINITY_DN196_c0_g1_i1:82-975(+)
MRRQMTTRMGARSSGKVDPLSAFSDYEHQSRKRKIAATTVPENWPAAIHTTVDCRAAEPGSDTKSQSQRFAPSRGCVLLWAPTTLDPKRCSSAMTLVDPLAVSHTKDTIGVAQANGWYARSDCVAYFETTIVELEEDAVSIVAVGFAPPMFHFRGVFPGATEDSYGIRSDDGLFLCGDVVCTAVGALPFAKGSVIGLGVTPQKQLFVTHNGAFVQCIRRIEPGQHIPTVGIQGSATVRLNFGAVPFKFDVERGSYQHQTLDRVIDRVGRRFADAGEAPFEEGNKPWAGTHTHFSDSE